MQYLNFMIRGWKVGPEEAQTSRRCVLVAWAVPSPNSLLARHKQTRVFCLSLCFFLLHSSTLNSTSRASPDVPPPSRRLSLHPPSGAQHPPDHQSHEHNTNLDEIIIRMLLRQATTYKHSSGHSRLGSRCGFCFRLHRRGFCLRLHRRGRCLRDGLGNRRVGVDVLAR